MIQLNRPVFLLPFYLLYDIMVVIFKFIFKFFKYFNVGLFFTIYIFVSIVTNFIILELKGLLYTFVWLSYILYKTLQYALYGFVVISYFVYRFIRYVFLGFAFPFVWLFSKLVILNDFNQKLRIKQEQERKQRAILREQNKRIEEENKKRLKEIESLEKAEEIRKQQEKYLNSLNQEQIVKEEKEEPKTISEKINNWFKKISNLFKKKDIDVNKKALLIDYEGVDAEKSTEKVMYKYTAKNSLGKIIKGVFPAHSKVEVHSFLLSEGCEVYSIETNKWIQLLYGSGSKENKYRIKTKDLIFFTAQLSTYLKAGITLVESLKILARQFKNKHYSRIFRTLIHDLSMGDSFSQAMDKQGEAFPRIFINMVKAAEMTGELPEVLDDMEDYFTETDKTRKQMITALTYPSIIFVLAIAAITFIMVWVVPQFVAIYEDIDGASIPAITIFVMNLSDFLQNSWYWILLGIFVFISIFVYLYKNIKAFKSSIQWFVMHIPVIGKVIIYNEVTMFTKTFSSLLAHNVFITDSMDILKRLTNNEVYKSLIFETIDNLAKGEKISLAFEDHWAFPMPAYEMIKTGEMTGQLPEMMSKVSAYYQELHKNSVARIKTFVEPALILFLTVVVGGIVLSIVIPMFSVYGAIQM